jgi:hypothetical protein
MVTGGKNLCGERRLVQMNREEDMPPVYLKRLQNTQNGVPPTPIGVDGDRTPRPPEG